MADASLIADRIPPGGLPGEAPESANTAIETAAKRIRGRLHARSDAQGPGNPGPLSAHAPSEVGALGSHEDGREARLARTLRRIGPGRLALSASVTRFIPARSNNTRLIRTHGSLCSRGAARFNRAAGSCRLARSNGTEGGLRHGFIARVDRG